MSIYLITYYLKEEEEESCGCGCSDHEHEHEEHHHHHLDAELTAIIRSLGAWAHLMPTSFLLRCDDSAEEILNKLKVAVKDKDLLFVTKVDPNFCASISPDVISWIKK